MAKNTPGTSHKSKDRLRLSLQAGVGGLLLAGLTYAYAQYVEPFWLELTTPRITLPRLPESLEGLRVLLLTDPHTQKWTRREDDVLALLKNGLPAAPEVIVWGGDFLYHFGETGVPLQLVRAVREIFPDVPTFGILGNAEHKWRRAHTTAFVQELNALGVRMLINTSETLTVRGQEITIAGVDDPFYGWDDLDKALAGTPKERFTLLLSHSPQIAYRAARAGVDLMLSGHTHGGQVRLPLIGAVKTQNTLGRKMDQGLFDAMRLRPILNGRDIGENFRLYICRGIGVAPIGKLHFPRPRLLSRPEIALFTLTRHCQPSC